MAMPILFVLVMLFGDNDFKAFVTTFGSVLLPFGSALWCVVLFRGRYKWTAFFVTAQLFELVYEARRSTTAIMCRFARDSISGSVTAERSALSVAMTRREMSG